jgi:hypothetical protein
MKQATADWTSFVSGIGGVALYAVLAAAAAAFLPHPFNPADNWLSDLGNSLLSPFGSISYRLAGMAAQRSWSSSPRSRASYPYGPASSSDSVRTALRRSTGLTR